MVHKERRETNSGTCRFGTTTTKKPRFDLPTELSCLRDGEKMLIQRAAAFVPLHHIRNGTLGAQGHCCSFIQETQEIASVLPRLPSEINFVEYVRTYKDEVGGAFKSKHFRVRRAKVVDALKWLKRYNTEYSDITIDESRLSWMEEKDEDDMAGTVNEIIEKSIGEIDEDTRNEECLAADQFATDNTEEKMGCFGVISPNDNIIFQKDDATISKALHESAKKKGGNPIMNWPKISDTPISEHDPSVKIFCMVYPWLFPGGIGDISCVMDGSMSKDEWAKRMICYEDGRFAADKSFCFYAHNYILRHRNQSQGGFFVNEFDKSCSLSLEELKSEIEKGDQRFIERVSYFSSSITGSNMYWRTHRKKVYSWINQLIEWGKGAPNMFITLSCAEYHWPDIIRLLEERLFYMKKKKISISVDSCDLVKYCNELTVVIQEYFQERVVLWIQHVGKPLFGIEHHWLRYEFAPGRGQIHCHMLAVSNAEILKKLHEFKDKPEFQAMLLGSWAETHLGMSASVDKKNTAETNHPCDMYYSDVKDHPNDREILKRKLMTHQCNDYCLRIVSKKEKGKQCRMGFGQESKPGARDTPGMETQTEHSIEKRDGRKHHKLFMTRNNPRLTQCSELMLESWRANCDIQLLIYDSDPKNPDASEISEVTDYVVGYCCKGNTTHKNEKLQMRDLIMR